ncbi:inositol monophosphatase family protein, partial [Haladaptatus sp.]|uniref:inositol monophosphatase family protein n=1 Tax=Haladaptatus sp. TaxID=1973141 RepID=UPI003C42C1BD
YLNGEEIAVSDRTDPETFTVCPTIWWDFDRREEYAATVEGIVKRFGDMRRFGCAQIVLGMVASGALDGTVTNVVPNPWDTVAGVFMVRRAGGTVTDIHGEPWTTESRGLVASNGEAHDEVLAAAREAEK